MFDETQQIAFDSILDLDIQIVFVIGEPGTGKSYTCLNAAKELAKHHTVMVSAVTNAATIRMEDEAKDTTINFCTLAQALNYQIYEKLELSKPVAIFNSESDEKLVFENEIFFLDECFLTDDTAIEWIINSIERGKIKKVIFSGDSAQLPPIQGRQSCLTSIRKFEKRVEALTYRYIELTEQYRHKGTISFFCDKFREKKYYPNSEDTTGNVIVTQNLAKWMELNAPILINKKGLHPLHFKHLCYTNRTSLLAARTVKRAVYGDYDYYVGEYLTANYTNKKGGAGIINGHQYKVVQVEETTVDSYVDPSYRYEAYYLIIESLKQIRSMVRVPALSEYIKWSNYQDRAQALGDAAAHDTIDDRETANIWWNKRIKEKDLFSDFTSCFSTTTHKAQGTNIPIVCVDLNDMVKAHSVSYERISYVAISRAVNLLVVSEIQQNNSPTNTSKIPPELRVKLNYWRDNTWLSFAAVASIKGVTKSKLLPVTKFYSNWLNKVYGTKPIQSSWMIFVDECATKYFGENYAEKYSIETIRFFGEIRL